MLNKWTSCLVVAFTAALLTACASSPTAESTGEYFDDAAITAKIKSAFLRDNDVRVNDVKVETYMGSVQLSGFASSRTEMDRAVQIARFVPGVKLVHNDIHLKPAPVSNRAGQTSTTDRGQDSGNEMSRPTQTDPQSEPIRPQGSY